MNIEQIFEKPLKRNINGVVKAEQTDDASAYIELDEYVITRELENHLRHFFESYVPATGPERILMENKIGVWVSGFFGSGKSGSDSNLLIVFYVQIMPDDLVMQLHRF